MLVLRVFAHKMGHENETIAVELTIIVNLDFFPSTTLHGLFLIRGIVKIQLVLPLTKIMIFI